MEEGVPKIVSVNGTTLHYITQGTGEPVIFVHGSLGDYRAWAPQFAEFAQKYHAVSYSRRYHAPNGCEEGVTDYTVGLHADDLIGLIEALDLAPANLVGNSFGAYTALTAATRRPDLIRKLVIGEPPIVAWLKEIPGGLPYWENFLQTTWEPAARAFQNGDLQAGVALFVDGVSGGKGIFDKIPDPVKQRMMDNACSLAAETSSPGYLTPPTTQQVEQIDRPVLLLRGENSPKMFHLIVERLAQCLPAAREVTIPNASHSMPSNNPVFYNQVVIDFLG